ncbi:MAG: hypothetical protein NTU48_04680 [Legionellales bacterium]|nr:hypothetical protein [Legionellales bacterium]
MKKTILLAASMALLSGMAFAESVAQSSSGGHSGVTTPMAEERVIKELNILNLVITGTIPSIYKQSYNRTTLTWTLGGDLVVQLDTSTCTEKDSQGHIKITYVAGALACAPASSQ